MHLDENQELVWRPAWNSPALTITLRMLYPQCQGAKPDGVPYNHMDRVTAAMEDFSIFAGWNVDVGMFCQQSPNVSCGSPAASCSSCSCPSSSFGLNSSHLLNNMGELFTDPSDQGMAPPWTHMTLFPQRIESPFLQGSPSILQRPYVHQQQCYPPVRPLQILPSNALASRPGSSASTSTLNQNKRKARHGACKSCRDRKKKCTHTTISPLPRGHDGSEYTGDPKTPQEGGLENLQSRGLQDEKSGQQPVRKERRWALRLLVLFRRLHSSLQ